MTTTWTFNRRSLLQGAAVALSLTVATGLLPAEANADELPLAVPAGTKLVVTDDANRFETLFTLSGERDKLASEVTFVNFSSGPIGLEAIRAGEVHVGEVADVPPILAHYSGADVLIVAAVRRDGSGLSIGTAPNSNIKSLADLKGKRVAFGEATAAQATVIRNLQSVGLTLADIEPVILAPSYYSDALISGEVDAAPLKQPAGARYLARAGKDGAISIPSAAGAYTGLHYLYASKAALADPALSAAIRDYVVHWYRAERWRNENQNVWLSEYLVKGQGIPAEDADAILKADGNASTPGFTDEILGIQQATIDLLQKAGSFADKELKAKDEFDFRFAKLSADDQTARDTN
ncbi:PhnD/SsuA/transferrin family substrate-binding protein [Shinella sp. S4-D37]|uniref:PhnD/SsuA/transferrin family substrate-binding protein n=1 Tax=Shinella sp. S4-D37 TaxID=3161999 RepID=UPI00346555C6